MSKRNFKIGDRVKIVSSTTRAVHIQDEQIGLEGNIVSTLLHEFPDGKTHKLYGVRLDKRKGPHDCKGKCEYGHGIFVGKKDLKLNEKYLVIEYVLGENNEV